MKPLRIDANGAEIRLSGHLDFATVPAAADELQGLIESGRELTLSLDGVERANSAGLVLLLELRQVAERAGARLRFRDLPDSLVNLAGMCNLEPLLDD